MIFTKVFLVQDAVRDRLFIEIFFIVTMKMYLPKPYIIRLALERVLVINISINY